MSKKALIIGANSDIAKETIRLLGDDWECIPLTREQYDLSVWETEYSIGTTIVNHQPDLIVHCAGIFGGNEVTFNPLFNVNVASAFWPINHYIKYPPKKQVKIVLIGSSCYSHGRKNYILYAASKAALHSVWEGASEAVSENVKIGIIHPVRVNTKMVESYSHPTPHLCLEASDVAEEIVRMTTMSDHTHLDMDYKKEINK